MSDAVGAAPDTRNPRFLALLFGAAAAPLFWLGQIMLGYGVSAFVCYPADHPVTLVNGAALQGALMAFNVIAIVGALVGLLTAWACLRTAPRESRTRFLAVWGIFSSLCFLTAILFHVIASIAVPLCVR